MQRTRYYGNAWQTMQPQLTTIFLHTKDQALVQFTLAVMLTLGMVSSSRY